MAGGSRRSAQTILIAALAAGKPVVEAARLAAVSERTTYRWMADPAFKARVEAVRAEMLETATGQLADATVAAVTALVSLLAPTAPATARLGAARVILDSALSYIEAQTLEKRLTALEQSQHREGYR